MAFRKGYWNGRKEIIASPVDNQNLRIGIVVIWGLNLFLTFFNLLNFLAPYLASLKNPLAGYIYLFFKPTCHQLAKRSIFLWGHQMGVCARCSGFWFFAMMAGYIFAIIPYDKKSKPMKPIWLLIGILPLALDGSMQFVGIYESTNISRIVTGAIAGAVAIVFAYSRLWGIHSSTRA